MAELLMTISSMEASVSTHITYFIAALLSAALGIKQYSCL